MSDRGYLIPEDLHPPDELCFQVPVPNDPGYIRAFWGQLQELSRWGMWERESTKSGTIAARRWFESYQRITDCEGEIINPYNPCGEIHLPNTDFISWAPNDPFLSPDHKPFGYPYPPWVAPENVVPGIELIGIEPTDVVTTMIQTIGGINPVSIFQFVAGVLLSGFPRFTIHVVGSGVVEIHLIKVPLGGLALINLDNSTTNQLVELSTYEITDFDSYLSQLAQIIGQGLSGTLFIEEIIEVEIEEDGEHDIHVTMLPQISTDQLIGFGGGLRSIDFCGGVQGATMALDIDFRINGKNLEWRKSPQSAWIDLGQVVGDDGIDGVCPPCDDDVGYGAPSNPDYYIRAARVVAEGVFDDLYRSYINDTPNMAYDAQTLEIGLPPTLRNYPSFENAIGDETTLGLNRANWWLSTHDVQVIKQDIVNHAACILLDMMQDNPLAFPSSYLDVGSYNWTTYIETAYDLNPNTDLPLEDGDLSLQQISLVAESLIQQLAVYANAYPATYVYAINWEANLSAITGVEVANCGGLFADWCRVFDFTTNDPLGWLAVVGTYSANGFIEGELVDGSNYRRLAAARYLLPGDSEIGTVSMTFDADFNGGDEYVSIELFQNGISQDSFTDNAPSDGTDIQFSHDFGGVTADEIRLTVQVSSGTGSAPFATATIKDAQADGVGIMPTDGDNCLVDTWCAEFDFSLDDYSEYWQISNEGVETGTRGIYEIPAWKASDVKMLAAQTWYRRLNLFAPLSSTVITKMEVTYNMDIGTNSAGTLTPQLVVTPETVNLTEGANVTKTWNGILTPSFIAVSGWVSSHASDPGQLDGYLEILKIKVWGNGENPFPLGVSC